MRLKDLELKKEEVLAIGFFNNNGKEYLIKGKYQVVKGWAFDTIKKNYDTEVVKVNGIYVTQFIAKKMGVE